MAIEPIAAAPPRLVMPGLVTPVERVQPIRPADSATDAPDDRQRRPLIPSRPARHVELSFHADLRTLMTKVLDTHTGDLISEYPSKKVLDTVADLMRGIQHREER